MNILLSTTIGHNPGDELIADGVKHLLRKTYPYKQLNFINYNRNPDLQEGELREARRHLVGNYHAGDIDLSYIDLVVLAGSPEWFGGPMKALYEALVKTPRPLWALGIGLGVEGATLTELDKNTLRRATKIVTRSVETTEFLKAHGIVSEALVCPALFHHMSQRFAVHAKGILNIVQGPGSGWHEIPPAAIRGADADPAADLGMVHIKELFAYQFTSNKKRYMSNSEEFRNTVCGYERVYSTRLHGAIGALGCGVPAAIVGNTDFRITTAQKMFGDILPIAKNFEEARKLELANYSQIVSFIEEQEHRWRKVLFA